MDAFGIAAVERRRLVGAPVLHAAAQDLAKASSTVARGSRSSAARLVPGRRLAVGERIAERRLAAGLDAQRRQLVELQRQAVERIRRAFQQLQLDLGDRHAIASRLDRAGIQGGLDQALAALLVDHPDAPHPALDPRRELALELLGRDQALQDLEGADRQDREIGLARGKRRLPLAAIADQAFGVVGLERLHVAAAVPAHAEREAARAQALVVRVVVDVLQTPGHAAPGRFVADRRAREDRSRALPAGLKASARFPRPDRSESRVLSLWSSHGVRRCDRSDRFPSIVPSARMRVAFVILMTRGIGVGVVKSARSRSDYSASVSCTTAG